MSAGELLAVIAVVFVLSALGTAGVRRLCQRHGLVATPSADRWHDQPTALHGGIGFFPGFALGVGWIFYRWYGVDGLTLELDRIPRDALLLASMLLGALLMLAAGVWDDLRQIRPATKLLFQVIAASLFVLVGGVFPLTGLLVADTLFTYFWFVGIINAVNMLDNMDGLSSGVVALAAITLVILAARSPVSGALPVAVAVGLVFVATLAGFWIFNYPPASIFMGDSGSLSIGFVLAALAIPSALNGFLAIPTESAMGPVLVLLIPAAVLAVPIFDTTLVTVTRKWRAARASQGGKDHSSHRLVGLGLPERTTVWILYSLAAFGGIIAVLLQRYPSQSLPLLALFALTLSLSGVYLGRVKVELAGVEKRPPAWTPLVHNLLFKRRFAEAVLDLVLTVICFYAAYLLRFDGQLPEESRQAVASALPVVVPTCLSAFFLAGIYRGQWHLLSVSDIPVHALGAGAGAGFSLAAVTLITRFPPGHSRGAYIIFGILLFLSLAGSRLSFRTIDALVVRHRRRPARDPGRAVLLYGAGKAGKLLYEELTSNPELSQYQALGFIDDDPGMVGGRLCGLSVRRPEAWLRVKRSPPPEIWISSQKVSDATARSMAARWKEPVTVRRLRLKLEPLQAIAALQIPDDRAAVVEDRDREERHG